ncbi:unnamed protein product, partial [Sphagnum compactum]
VLMRNFINIYRQCLYQFGFSFLFKCFQVLKLTRQEALHSTGLEATLRFGSFSSLKVCYSEHEDIQFYNPP